MTPEVWKAIRQDWRESLPAVLAGEDDKFYPFGWAKENKAPRSAKTSLHYICSIMRWDVRDILSMKRHASMCRRRDAVGLALHRKHKNPVNSLAKLLHRDWSSMRSLLERAKLREKSDAEFADLVKSLECLI